MLLRNKLDQHFSTLNGNIMKTEMRHTKTYEHDAILVMVRDAVAVAVTTVHFKMTYLYLSNAIQLNFKIAIHFID